MNKPLVGTVWRGTKFDVRYLNNLYAMIKRNATVPFDFVAITDNNDGVNSHIATMRPSNSTFFPWWDFMTFYRADLWQHQTRIYFGLDTIIRGNIDFVLCQQEYTLSRDFNYLIGNPSRLFADTYADCAAVIPAGGMEWLYDAFLAEHQASSMGNTQYPMHVWVTKQLRMAGVVPILWQDINSKALTSGKWPMLKLTEPEEAMIFYHGEPKIHNIQADWIKAHWHG